MSLTSTSALSQRPNRRMLSALALRISAGRTVLYDAILKGSSTMRLGGVEEDRWCESRSRNEHLKLAEWVHRPWKPIRSCKLDRLDWPWIWSSSKSVRGCPAATYQPLSSHPCDPLSTRNLLHHGT